jgi:hypothetical protein
VPAEIIHDMVVSLADRHHGPGRQEGFAHLVPMDPTQISDLAGHCRHVLSEIDHSLRYAGKRRSDVRPHHFSMLLDLERLLYLIKLLLDFPGLNFTTSDDPASGPSVPSSPPKLFFSPQDPLPGSDEPFATRAAFLLAHRHGPCYGDPVRVEHDLQWLQAQGFTSLHPITTAVDPGPPSQAVLTAMATGVGFPPAADRAVFQRQLSLLRHLIQNPFDRSLSLSELEKELPGRSPPRRGRRRIIAAAASSTPPLPAQAQPTQRLRPPGVREHLLQRLEAIPGVSYNGQVRRLDKDIELLLTPYGFRDPLPMTDSPPQSSKSQASRRGIALGTALLTATQLKEVHTLIKQSYRNLKDPTLLALQEELEERLSLAGVAVDSILPVRGFANRSIIDPQHLDDSTIAHRRQLEKVEEAILERRQIRIKAVAGSSHASLSPAEDQSLIIWPLQILFHNIAWYLAYESSEVGRNRGLLSISRLDRLKLIDVLRSQRPVHEARDAQLRLGNLCRRSGGIFLGGDAEHQRKIGVDKLTAEQLRSLENEGVFIRVRFWCNKEIFRVFQEGNNRFPAEQISLSEPLPEEARPWPAPGGRALKPDPAASHPYPVELLLPIWTVTIERDFRRWLFGFGDQIRIEAPAELREQHRHYGAGIAALYAKPVMAAHSHDSP